MFDPTLCDGSVTTLRGSLGHAMNPPEAGITALHVLAGQPKLGHRHLDAGDTAFLDASAHLNLGEDDAVLEITVQYLDQSKAIKFSIVKR